MARDFDSLEAMESVYGPDYSELDAFREDDDFEDEETPLTAGEMDAMEMMMREYDLSECREEPDFGRRMDFLSEMYDDGDE